MAITPVFQGYVDQSGKMTLDHPGMLRKHCEALAGSKVEVVIRKRKSARSLAQNAWNWGVAIPLIAEVCGYDRHEHEALHYALVEKCFGTTWNERLQVHVPNARSSKLTTKQFGEYMEWLVRYAAESLDTVVPLPDEVDLSAYTEAA